MSKIYRSSGESRWRIVRLWSQAAGAVKERGHPPHGRSHDLIGHETSEHRNGRTCDCAIGDAAAVLRPLVLYGLARHAGAMPRRVRSLHVMRSSARPRRHGHGRMSAHHAQRREEQREHGQDPNEAPCNHQRQIGSPRATCNHRVSPAARGARSSSPRIGQSGRPSP